MKKVLMVFLVLFAFWRLPPGCVPQKAQAITIQGPDVAQYVVLSDMGVKQ
jgi:hypothetical protein